MANYSFDVFDTLVSRKLANDRGVFVVLREKLKHSSELEFSSAFIDEFVNLRLHAQRIAHKNSSCSEITLKEIYTALGMTVRELRPEHLELLQTLEEKVEIEISYPIPDNISKITELVAYGHEVFLISDMYLSKAVVTAILSKADPRLSTLPLYLSSELKLRKSDGTLFRHVCEERAIPPSSLIHTGDSFHSDCVMAKRAGINYVFYQESSLSKIEKSYFTEEQNLFLQLYAGASKQTRLEGYNLTPTYRLGASFMAPMFYGFVHDSLIRAANEGIKRLYFLARDGYLLKIIAEEIVECFDYDIEIRYLYTSRQSTYFASIFYLTARSFHWIFQEMDNVITFNVVAKRLHAEPDVLIGYLDEDLRKDLITNGLHNRLTKQLVSRLQSELINNIALKSKIESEAKAYRTTAIKYFEQEGLLLDERIGFIDIGWKGTLQDAIFRILKSKKPTFKLTSFYLGVTYFSANTYAENRKVPTYMFPSTRARKGPILELLLQCDHGTTLFYQEEQSGEVKPVLKAPSRHLERWGLDHYKKGIRQFSRTLSQSLATYPDLEITYAAIIPILVEILEDATPEVAATLGDLYYSGNIEESNTRMFAPPFSISQALMFMLSSERRRRSYTQWFDGSYSRSQWIPKLLLRLDPRLNFMNIVKNYVSREKLTEKKQFIQRFIQLHFGFKRN